MDLTPISARQLLCGKATELRQWVHLIGGGKHMLPRQQTLVPPSDESSSGIP